MKELELSGHKVVKTLELISKKHGMKISLLKNNFKKTYKEFFFVKYERLC